MIKRIFMGAAGLFVLLLIIVLFRTFTFGGAPDGVIEIDLPTPPAISAEAGAQHLSEAIRFKTITFRAGDPKPEQAQPWLDLHDWLGATYPNVHERLTLEFHADYSLLYKWEGRDASLDPIILMAHQDVVPVNLGTLSDWTGAPFAGEIVDGYIYGRGALDDKSALIAILEAGEALLESGFEPQRTVYFMFGHDEEVSGRGAETMVNVLHERGVRAELVLDEGFFIIEDSPITGRPMGFIGVAEKGYITLKLTASAVGGHSSAPPRNSANVQLARAIVALDENQMKADFSKPPVSDLFRAAAPDMGFGQRMALANMWLFRGIVEGQLSNGAANAMVRTTTAPTMLEGSIKENVLPQRSSAIVNFRVHPNDTPEDVMAHARDIAGQFDVEVALSQEGGIGSAASPVSPVSNRSYSVLKAVASHAGEGALTVPGLVIGATDARFASKISDNVYRFVPSLMTLKDTAGFHGTNERLSVANMGRMAEGYAQLILAMDAP
ncbi:MAG: M20 family peptidase [Hyphomonadaceae bacterium]